VRVGEGALGEEVGQDPDDVVAEFALVAVHAGIERIAAACELSGDEAALVRVDQCRRGDVNLGDSRKLLVPEPAHVHEVLIEAAGAGQLGGARPGRRRTEPVRGDDVVVLCHAVGRHGVGWMGERHQARRRRRVHGDRVPGLVGDPHPAVDRDIVLPTEGLLVGELRDGHVRAAVGERRHLGGQVATSVGPGRALPVVQAEPVAPEVPVGAVLNEEGPAEAGHDAVVVTQPPDRRRRAVGSGECVGLHVEAALVGAVGSRLGRRLPGRSGCSGDSGRTRDVQQQAGHDQGGQDRCRGLPAQARPATATAHGSWHGTSLASAVRGSPAGARGRSAPQPHSEPREVASPQ